MKLGLLTKLEGSNLGNVKIQRRHSGGPQDMMKGTLSGCSEFITDAKAGQNNTKCYLSLSKLSLAKF